MRYFQIRQVPQNGAANSDPRRLGWSDSRLTHRWPITYQKFPFLETEQSKHRWSLINIVNHSEPSPHSHSFIIFINDFEVAEFTMDHFHHQAKPPPLSRVPGSGFQILKSWKKRRRRKGRRREPSPPGDSTEPVSFWNPEPGTRVGPSIFIDATSYWYLLIVIVVCSELWTPTGINRYQ